MFINVPNKITKKDIKKLGCITKDEGYAYVLSDIIDNNYLELKCNGFYSYIYNVCNSYLFMIGNAINTKDISINKVDFLGKIMEFEYKLQNSPKKFIKFDIPNNILTITSKQRYLTQDLRGVNTNLIQSIINNNKIHLQTCQTPMEQFNRYLCDNENGVGLWEYGLSLNMFYDKYVQILKDTSIAGYIIKYNHDLF